MDTTFNILTLFSRFGKSISNLLDNLLNTASSKSNGRLVAANTNTLSFSYTKIINIVDSTIRVKNLGFQTIPMAHKFILYLSHCLVFTRTLSSSKHTL
jgi:hypothetical protein